jgi:hypothetical protein
MPARAGPTSPLTEAARHPLRPWWRDGPSEECPDAPSPRRRQWLPGRGGLLELDLVLAFYGNYGDPVLNVPQRAAYRS